eukprot:15060687-Heterocapsa_arctica.AAC.1
MASAIVNGPRQNGKMGEFRHAIKACLTHRRKWTEQTHAHNTTYAKGGCGRWTPGAHFAKWEYDTIGHYEPDKDSYVAERYRRGDWARDEAIDLTG